MTEAEWLACTDPRPMVRFLEGRASDRKLRLFACGGCRRVWKSLSVKAVRKAVEASERFADGEVTAEELGRALGEAVRSYDRTFGRNVRKLASDADYAVKAYKLGLALGIASPAPTSQVILIDAPQPDEGIFQTIFDPALLRCVAGNPFRPITVDPRWLTSTAVSLARAIYEERAFDRLPILADALEEAGCNDDLLSHCRGDGPHVRGCWAVDLVLGKD